MISLKCGAKGWVRESYECLLAASHDTPLYVLMTMQNCGACIRLESRKKEIRDVAEKLGQYLEIHIQNRDDPARQILLSVENGAHSTVPNLILFDKGVAKAVHPLDFLEEHASDKTVRGE